MPVRAMVYSFFICSLFPLEKRIEIIFEISIERPIDIFLYLRNKLGHLSFAMGTRNYGCGRNQKVTERNLHVIGCN